jgi:hypothetical protein
MGIIYRYRNAGGIIYRYRLKPGVIIYRYRNAGPRPRPTTPSGFRLTKESV